MATKLDEVVQQIGELNEVKATLTLACRLTMSREDVVRALGGGGALRLKLPKTHPLDPFDAGDGPQGPIPEQIELGDFIWEGGGDSWREKPLEAFAGMTRGSASFILVDGEGQTRAYEIDDGRLYRCDFAMAFARRGEDGEPGVVKLRGAGRLLKRLFD